jgi:hypothetical protein
VGNYYNSNPLSISSGGFMSIADNLERARRLHRLAQDTGLPVSDYQKSAGIEAGYEGDWYQVLHSMAEDARKKPDLQLPSDLDTVLLEFERQVSGAIAQTGNRQSLWNI